MRRLNESRLQESRLHESRLHTSRLHTSLLAIGLALLAACGASDKMAPASMDQPKAPAPSFAHLTIVDAGPLAGLHFEHYGVNPTVDTAEQPTSSVGLRADRASFALAQLQMGQGALPEAASIRVEDFVNAMPLPAPPPTNAPIARPDVEAFPSPHRPGYHVLRVSLFAAPRAGPRRVVAVIDAAAHRREIVVARLRQLAAQLTPGDALAVVYADGQVALAPTPAGDARVEVALAALTPRHGHQGVGVDAARRLARGPHQPAFVYLTDGLAHRGQPSFDALLAAARAPGDRRPAWAIIGVGRGPYDDARMAQLAAATGGQYLFAGAGVDVGADALAPAIPSAWDATARVTFDPAVVTRYRLLGQERHARDAQARRGVGAALSSASPVTALYEVKLAKSADGRALGQVTLAAVDASGQRQTQVIPLPRALVQARFEAASPAGRQALIAAALAEKLRGAWWARGVTYATLQAELAQIPPARQSPQLAAMLGKAAALDTRKDAYAAHGPVAQMSFDHVPIVRR